MGEKIYQVLYADKFVDVMEAAVTAKSLRRLFGLDDKVAARLASGRPVVVKMNAPYAVASPIHAAICDAGGTCWIEEMTVGQSYTDRRHERCRELLDRRSNYRGSAIVPDRRMEERLCDTGTKGQYRKGWPLAGRI